MTATRRRPRFYGTLRPPQRPGARAMRPLWACSACTPETHFCGFGGRRMEADVFRRATREAHRGPAVNARGPHREIELLVRSRITSQDCLPFFVVCRENSGGTQNFFGRRHCLSSLKVDGRQPPLLSRTLDRASLAKTPYLAFNSRRLGVGLRSPCGPGWIASPSFGLVSRPSVENAENARILPRQ